MTGEGTHYRSLFVAILSSMFKDADTTEVSQLLLLQQNRP